MLFGIARLIYRLYLPLPVTDELRAADNATAKAKAIVAGMEDRPASPAARDGLVIAFANDLGTASASEERLTKIETQTRVLAEAVIAITETPAGLAPAVQAVKDEM